MTVEGLEPWAREVVVWRRMRERRVEGRRSIVFMVEEGRVVGGGIFELFDVVT